MVNILRWRQSLSVAVWVGAAVLAGCGGGGGDAVPTPPPTTPTPPPISATPTLSVYAGSLQQAGSQDGAGSASQFNLPIGVVQDAAGNAYVADTGNHTIRKVSPQGTVTTVAGLAGQAGNADGSAGGTRFSSPAGLAIDTAGNVYVADSGNHTIRKISPVAVVSTVAGVAGQAGSVDGSSAVARLQSPTHVAVDGAGNLYVLSGVRPAVAVRKVARDGSISTWVGPVPNAAPFSALAADPAGSIYVVNASLPGSFGGGGDGAVLKFDAQGRAQTFANPELSLRFGRALTVDSAGNVWIVRSGFVSSGPNFTTQIRAVERISPNGSVTLVLNGVSPGVPVPDFPQPLGISISTNGTVVLTDATEHGVFRIDVQGKLATLAGGLGRGLVDGVRGNARFSFPGSLSSTPDGTLYVADLGNGRVRKITPEGTASTLASGFGSDFRIAAGLDGTVFVERQQGTFGRSVSTISPAGAVSNFFNSSASNGVIAVDAAGRLLLAVNNSVVRVNSNGTTSTLASGFTSASGFTALSGIVADSTGTVFVATSEGVQAIDPQGRVRVVVNLAQALGAGYAGRGKVPGTLALDPAGNLYLADDNTILQITPAGQVRTLVGALGNTNIELGKLPGAVTRVNGLTWTAGSLYASVNNAVTRIGPLP